MMKKLYFTAMLITIFVLLLAGCGEDTVFPGNDSENRRESVTSAVVSVPMEKVRTLNPLLSRDEDAYYLNKLIYDGLFVLNDNLQAVGALAESYEYTEGAGTLQVRLRQGVLWQDGEAFDADDVKFTIDAYLSVPGNQQGSHGSSVALIRSVRVIDPLTVQIQFADPNNAAVENLTFPILPSHKHRRAADLIRDAENFMPVGTGPYYISNFEEGKQITLSGNGNYRGTAPQNTIVFKFMPNKGDAVNLFNIGEISITLLKDIERDTLVEDKVVKMVSFPSNEVEVLGFNFNHGALQDRSVRQAIARAVDNQMILETCYYGNGVLSDSIYYPGYMGAESEEPLYEYDANAAADMLKAAGYEGLSLNLVFNGENRARNLTAQVIKSGLERAGVSVTLVSLVREEYDEALQRGNFDLYIGGYRFNENYDLRSLLSTGGSLNYINYSYLLMDGLLDRLQQGIPADEKRAVFESLHKLYIDEIPYYGLLYKTYGLAASTSLTGDVLPYFNHVYNGCESWRMVYEKSEGE